MNAHTAFDRKDAHGKDDANEQSLEFHNHHLLG
jgi:hypothetical protein